MTICCGAKAQANGGPFTATCGDCQKTVCSECAAYFGTRLPLLSSTGASMGVGGRLALCRECRSDRLTARFMEGMRAGSGRL